MSSTSDFWLARTYYCASTAVTAWIAIADETSKHSFAFSSDGAGGHIAVAFLLYLATMGLVDICMDRMGVFDGPAYLRLKQKRFLLYMAIAGGHGSLLFANVVRWQAEPYLWRYAIDCFFGLAIAVLLVARRYRWYRDTVL